MKRICDACGSVVDGGTLMGGALVCRSCDVEMQSRIEATAASGKSVNAKKIAKEIYKETHSGGDYLFRDIPAELWDKAKHRAIDEKCSLRDVLLFALNDYLAK